MPRRGRELLRQSSAWLRNPRALRWLARRKQRSELAYWISRSNEEGELRRSWYERCFTAHFGLDRDFYAGKRVLDIGCGPRGSLEWADGAAERVGLDPLADSYLKLGAERQAMSYVAGEIEHAPFADESFDVVSSFNSLDHVDDLDAAISEMTRVLAGGGLLLVVTELNHEATSTEPQSFSWEVVERFPAELELIERRDLESDKGDMYTGLEANVPFDHEAGSDRFGVLSLKLRKRGRSSTMR